MPDTFIKIASVTVGSGGASSIDFTSIPSTYTDLCLMLSTRTTFSGGERDVVYLNFNGSSSGYTYRRLYGIPTVATGSDSGSSGYVGYTSTASCTSNTFGNASVYIPNYAGSNNKSFSNDAVSETNSSPAGTSLIASLWSNTAAINRVTLYGENGTFVQYSTATLYGIKSS